MNPLVFILLVATAGRAPTPINAPPYTPADAAIIIEHLELDLADQKYIVLQLVDDFARQWMRLLDGYSVELGQNTSKDAEAIQAARHAYQEAAKASAEATRAVSQLEEAIKTADKREAPNLHEQLLAAKASRTDLLEQARAAGDSRMRLFQADPEYIDRTSKTFDRNSMSLIEQFEGDVRLLLTPEQQDRWAALTRKFTRRWLLRAGHLGGEHLNLDTVILRIHPNMSPEELSLVEPVMREWRHEIDVALKTRSQHDHSAVPRPDARQQVALLVIRRDVRDCTLKHLNLMCQRMGGARGEQIRDLAMRMGFPDRFRPTKVERALEYCLAEAVDDRKEVEDLQKNHADQMKTLRTSQIAILLKIDGHEELAAVGSQARAELDPSWADTSKTLDHLKRLDARQETIDHKTYRQLQKIVGRSTANKAMRQRMIHP
ncbi:MAG: hypothetical protein GY894_04605 [Planctomycetes bacterium]|jgi:hypothetical protein|nr:hypothetical protein [Planctomycetota bacterium]MCP4838627.1 hypothetical protein [Planctomycetota bacterium]